MHFTFSFEQMRLILLIWIEFGHRNTVKDQANNGNKNNPTIEAAQFRTTTTKKPNGMKIITYNKQTHKQRQSKTIATETKDHNNRRTKHLSAITISCFIFTIHIYNTKS